jgi:hypothetical protein
MSKSRNPLLRILLDRETADGPINRDGAVSTHITDYCVIRGAIVPRHARDCITSPQS